MPVSDFAVGRVRRPATPAHARPGAAGRREAGATVLLISDGHENAGITDPDTLALPAAQAGQHRVTSSTLGLGLGYDERIMSAIARGGSGNEHFAEEPDTAVAPIAGEVEGLLAQAADSSSGRSTRTAPWLAPSARGLTAIG